NRPPRRSNEALFNRDLLTLTLLTGLLTAGVTLGVFAYERYLGNSLEQARDAAFTALVIAELMRAFGARSERRTIWQIGLFSNMRLFLVVAVSFSLQFAIHHVPILQTLFQIGPVPLNQCAAWIVAGFIPLMVLELRKIVRRLRAKKKGKTMKKHVHGKNYTCPMHPEVSQEQPGSCPKCGMALELMAPVESKAPEIRTEYVCPMHPEIIRSEPGSCPKCGMALEPKNVSGDGQENCELTAMSRRFWVSTALSIPVFMLAMAHDLMPAAGDFFSQWRQWLEFALATPVVLWGGWPFFQRGWRSVINRSLNMFTLIALGIGVAWVYSVTATFAPDIFAAARR
ncbi:cation transporting ATPase C-terminal domain-containing protein, partial [Rhodoferax sp.]|uniref:cation transporting ATPase C-terminal domain-containing protein n=1 Tax=Rhodoferax sp. TaxID=50421 RepID=UPI00271C83E3